MTNEEKTDKMKSLLRLLRNLGDMHVGDIRLTSTKARIDELAKSIGDEELRTKYQSVCCKARELKGLENSIESTIIRVFGEEFLREERYRSKYFTSKGGIHGY